MNKLKPCPLCECKTVWAIESLKSVKCCKCGLQLKRGTIQKTIQAWNKR